MKSTAIALIVTGSVTVIGVGGIAIWHARTSSPVPAPPSGASPAIAPEPSPSDTPGHLAPTPLDTLDTPSTDSSSDSSSRQPDALNESEDTDSMLSTSPTTALAPVHDLFDPAIADMRSHTQVPMLLPSALPDTVMQEPLYIHHDEGADYYVVVLGLRPDCTASVCAVGSLEAAMNGEPYLDEFSETVQLAQGIQGYFQPMTCGASCSPPVLGWRYEGAFYRLYLKLPGSDADVRAALVAAANSAIARGSL